jgi:protein subunit release factor B
VRERVLHLTRDDFTWQYFRAGGKGGQNQNKRDTGVRCIHAPSGARGESREHRTQAQNRRQAFRRCAESPEFLRWVKIQHAGIAAAVEEAMRPDKLLVEYGPFESAEGDVLET